MERKGLWLYFNVETPSGFSQTSDAQTAMELAKEVKIENPNERVELEIVLMRDDEIVYQDNQTVSERIVLIP